MADSAYSLGKISGVEIQLHWTFVFLLIITLLFGLFFGPFLFVFIVLLFTMVVLHELAHSVTAIRNGIKVKKIILLPLGGASIIDLDEVKPDVSFRIAFAGPMASIVLGMFFGLLAVFTPTISLQPFLPVPLNQIFQLLFLLNILLGVFNLLPAFPLDGGRLLKSYLQEKRDNFEATKLAVNVSKTLMVAIMVASVGYAVVYPGPGGSNWFLIVLWDFIIVIFIYGAAQAELQSAYITKYTAKLKVSDATGKNFVLVKEDTSMRELYKILLSSGGLDAILFKSDGGFKKVQRLNANPMRVESQEILSKKVKDYGTPIPKIDYNAPLSKAIEKMRYEEAGLMAVTKGGRLVGILGANHVESIIALHIPHTMPGRREQTNK